MFHSRLRLLDGFLGICLLGFGDRLGFRLLHVAKNLIFW